MDNNTQVNVEELSITDMLDKIIAGVVQFWWLFLILIISFGALGYKRAKTTYVPIYSSKATISITAPTYSGDKDLSRTNDEELAKELGVSFNYLINNDLFYEVIRNDMGVSYLNGQIMSSVLEGTNILTLEVQSSNPKDAYYILLSVMKNYSSVAQFVLGDTQLTVLEEPAVPTKAINPFSFYKTVLIFVFAGIIIAMIPVLIFGFVIKTIQSREDIENYMSIKCYGALPNAMVPKLREDGTKEPIKKPSIYKRILCSVSRNARVREQDKDSGKQLILDKKIGFRYLEAIRSISTRIDKDMQTNDYKVLLITSTLPKEGKSTFSINLALTLSKFGKRVMLIDGDLRKPSLRNLSEVKGISYNMKEFLNKKVSLKDALMNIADTRVVMIAADKPTPNPIENINSVNMENILEQCKNVADYVIIDAPACSGVADAIALSKYADTILYVVREDFVKVNTVLDVLQELSYTKKPILGSVLNDSIGVVGLNNGYGRGYSYAYGRGYGYGYGRIYGYGYRYGYGYGYGGYGYGKGYGGSYGYGESSYEKVDDAEFMAKEQKTAKRIVISNESIDEQKDKVYENESQPEDKKD